MGINERHTGGRTIISAGTGLTGSAHLASGGDITGRWTPAAAAVKGTPSTGNGACVTVQRISDGGMVQARTPVPDGEGVKSTLSSYNGECVTVQKAAEAVEYKIHEDRIPAAGAVKSTASAGNGECVTVQRAVSSPEGIILSGREPADGAVKSIASTGTGECVTVQRYEAGSIALWDSKQGDNAPRWYFHPSEWAEFISAVRAGAIANDTLKRNNNYNNIVVADDADVEIEIIDGEYHWSFSRFPDIVHVYTRGEMSAFIYAAYTEQFTETELWDGKIMCTPDEELAGV